MPADRRQLLMLPRRIEHIPLSTIRHSSSRFRPPATPGRLSRNRPQQPIIALTVLILPSRPCREQSPRARRGSQVAHGVREAQVPRLAVFVTVGPQAIECGWLLRPRGWGWANSMLSFWGDLAVIRAIPARAAGLSSVCLAAFLTAESGEVLGFGLEAAGLLVLVLAPGGGLGGWECGGGCSGC